MIARALRTAHHTALRRVARAQIGEWCVQVVNPNDFVQRNVVGHLEDWREKHPTKSFGIEPLHWHFVTAAGEYDARAANACAMRFSALVQRVGLERAVALVQREAKRCLGKKP